MPCHAAPGLWLRGFVARGAPSILQVIAAFEGRMNDREEVQVARLLEDSVGSLSLNDSAANSNSPARYGAVRCGAVVLCLIFGICATTWHDIAVLLRPWVLCIPSHPIPSHPKPSRISDPFSFVGVLLTRRTVGKALPLVSLVRRVSWCSSSVHQMP